MITLFFRIGVQPVLGLEGDPMRLLFERDLTPHPQAWLPPSFCSCHCSQHWVSLLQYAAFYKWVQNEYQADAIIHFGMHGTVEWLPGSPLGNTGTVPSAQAIEG